MKRYAIVFAQGDPPVEVIEASHWRIVGGCAVEFTLANGKTTVYSMVNILGFTDDVE